MAYKIQYSPEEAHRYPQGRSRKTVSWHRWFFVIAILLGLVWLRVRGVPDFLIPGDREVTIMATKNMVDNLQQGIEFNEAVTVFCKEILHGAGF